MKPGLLAFALFLFLPAAAFPIGTGSLEQAKAASEAGFGRWEAPAFPIPLPRAPAPARAPASSFEDILQNLPAMSDNDEGVADAPVSLLFIGPEASVRSAILRAGWTEATTSMVRAIIGGIVRWIERRSPGVFPPVSPELLFGRPQDMAFVQPLDLLRRRHHFRLWRAPWDGPRGEPVWAGTASFDVDLGYRRERPRDRFEAERFYHRIDHRLDLERDYIAATLGPMPEVAETFRVRHPRAVLSGADANGSPFETDGRVLVVVFR